MRKDLYNNKLFNIENLKMGGYYIKEKAQMLLLAGIIIAVTIASMGIIVGSISGARVTAIMEKPNPIFSEYNSLRSNFKILFDYNWRSVGYDANEIYDVFNYTIDTLNKMESRYGRHVDGEVISIKIYGNVLYLTTNISLYSPTGMIYEMITETYGFGV